MDFALVLNSLTQLETHRDMYEWQNKDPHPNTDAFGISAIYEYLGVVVVALHIAVLFLLLYGPMTHFNP